MCYVNYCGKFSSLTILLDIFCIEFDIHKSVWYLAVAHCGFEIFNVISLIIIIIIITVLSPLFPCSARVGLSPQLSPFTFRSVAFQMECWCDFFLLAGCPSWRHTKHISNIVWAIFLLHCMYASCWRKFDLMKPVRYFSAYCYSENISLLKSLFTCECKSHFCLTKLLPVHVENLTEF